MNKRPRNVPETDNVLRRDPDIQQSSSYQKREGERIAREDSRNTRGAAGSRGSYLRGNMEGYDDDYDPRNMSRNALQSEFGGQRGSHVYHERDGYRYDDGPRRDNYGNYGNYREGFRNRSFPEDRGYDDYLERRPRYIHRGYRENQGQYSANNYDTPPHRNRQGGMNYGSGRDYGYSRGEEGRYRNYDGDRGGYNPEREEQTYREFGYFNEHPRFNRDEYESDERRRHFRNPEDENRWRNRRENDRW
jgi:hypothetical protein